MDYVFLGGTGIRVSELCFGTMSFGGDADEATSALLYARCREAGVNFFDTADVYAGGIVAAHFEGPLISFCARRGMIVGVERLFLARPLRAVKNHAQIGASPGLAEFGQIAVIKSRQGAPQLTERVVGVFQLFGFCLENQPD